MTDTDLLQPDPGPLRAAAEAAELAQAVSGLVSIDGCRLADSDPLAPLARDIASASPTAVRVATLPSAGVTRVLAPRSRCAALRALAA